MHIPVLLKETVDCLDPRANENFVDCTLGEAGHASEILKRTGPRGKLLGIDQDPRQIEECREKLKSFGKRAVLENDNFANLKKIVKERKFGPISGILLDLGISSWHLEESQKGFSFLKDEELDMRLSSRASPTGFPMRLDPDAPLTARKIVNEWPEAELKKALEEHGQERFAGRIARSIAESRKRRPIERSSQLAEIIRRSVPGNYSGRGRTIYRNRYENGRIHASTRTFLALRILVNDEPGKLQTLLPQALEVLKKEGRLVVISFNSAEDRLVKVFFREQARLGKIKTLTPKPLVAGPEEREANPRSRSAKLRVAIKSHDHFSPSFQSPAV